MDKILISLDEELKNGLGYYYSGHSTNRTWWNNNYALIPDIIANKIYEVTDYNIITCDFVN